MALTELNPNQTRTKAGTKDLKLFTVKNGAFWKELALWIKEVLDHYQNKVYLAGFPQFHQFTNRNRREKKKRVYNFNLIKLCSPSTGPVVCSA